MVDIKLKIKAYISSTEDPEKIKKAITNIFGSIELKEHEDVVTGETSGLLSLRSMKEHLARDRVRDAVRVMLERWSNKQGKVSFQLNRQAAYANHISIYHADKAPLGPIEVEVDGDPEQIIKYLCNKSP